MNLNNKIETKIIFLPKNIQLYKKGNKILLIAKDMYLLLVLPVNIKLIKNNKNLLIKFNLSQSNLCAWFIFLKNLIVGLSRAYNARLYLNGVGYKVYSEETNLSLKLGYSHIVNYLIMQPTQFNIYKNSIIQLSSPLKNDLGLISSTLRKLKKKDVYKGKGILFEREKITLKTGKQA